MDRTSTASHGEFAAALPTASADDGDSGAAPSPASTQTETSCNWHTLLSGSPREVLARLVRDDPLDVRARVASRLRAEAVLLDGDRVHLRALARISRAAGAYRGRPELADWVDGAVAETVQELVREEHELARSRTPIREGREGREGREDRATVTAAVAVDPDAFTSLATPLGLDPGSVRRACATFDVLPFAERDAFFRLVLEAGDLDAAAREVGVSASEVARRARRALDAILATTLGVAVDAEKARKR